MLECVAEFRIERRRVDEARLGARNCVGRRAVGAVERLLGFERGSGELACVGEHGSLLRQLFIFAGDETGAFEFGRAEPCELEQIGAFTLAAIQFLQARLDFFCARVAFAIRREFVVEIRVAIENLAMALGAKQRMLLVLSINLHQRRADFAEALHGGEFAVDRDARASAALGDHPAHEQFAPPAVAFARGQFRHRGLALELEQSLDDSFFLARADHVGRGARAEQQSERAQDDRFAGAGFAG